MSVRENRYIAEHELKEFCVKCLRKYGMKEESAHIIANDLVQTDKWGIASHGTKNLYNYIQKAIAGGVSFTEAPEIIKEQAAIALMDGKNSMGFLSATQAMELACQKARETGMGMVVVKNSCHFGAAGCYSNIAATKGMIGGAFSNVDRFMVIPGAKKAVMGQNPLSLAAPASMIPSVFLDISTSNVAALKVVNERKKGNRVPKDWIVDKEGNRTDDPSRFPEEGALLPMAMHKGYGIALFIEIITSVIAGGMLSMSGNVPSWNLKLNEPNQVSHSFVAIDADKMFYEGYTRERIDEMIRLIHEAPKADGVDRLYVPGEMEWDNSQRAGKEGVLLPEMVYDELMKLSELSGYQLKGL